MKIYAVSQGEYSGYEIFGLYSTKELAEEAKKLFASDNGIEEYELDALPAHRKGLYFWEVAMNRQGDIVPDRRSEAGVVRTSVTEYREGNDAYPVDSSFRSKKTDAMRFRVWAKDEGHAIKVANERRAQMIASGDFESDWDAWKAKRKP